MNDKYEIDFVVTWVDSADPIWNEKKARYVGDANTEGNTEARYRDWDTLRYWFRGVEKFAPWVRNIYFVTDNQKPQWLNVDHPKLKWVKHAEYIPDEYLPTFQSHPIEWNLFRIKGLSEQFVYFNDDIFLIRDTNPEDFFVNGLPCDMPRIDYLLPGDMLSHILFNNISLLNRHFTLRNSICAEKSKWFKGQSLKGIIKNLFLGRKDLLPSFEEYHIHVSLLKSTLATLWEKEYLLIHETCKHRQRTKADVSIWCARDWQLLSGLFHPKKPCGKYFSTSALKYSDNAIKYLEEQKGKVICLNDVEDEMDFLLHQKMIIDAFDELLPEKSSFEL